MKQKVAKIQNALKSEYADFASFCKLSDKQFVHELTMSDYIAFRSQMGVSREYVAGIQQLLADYNPDEDETEDQPMENEEGPSTDSNILAVTDSNELIVQNQSPTYNNGTGDGIANNEIEVTRKDLELIDLTESKLLEKKSKPAISVANLELIDLHSSLYVDLGIAQDPSYSEQNVDALDLSTRALNCLKRNHCHTLDDLFSRDVKEIKAFKNLGGKSFAEIIESCKAFAANYAGPSNIYANDMLPEPYNRKEALNSFAKSLVYGMAYDISALPVQEQEDAKLLEEAYEILGGDLSLTAFENPLEVKPICLALLYLYARQSVIETCEPLLDELTAHGFSKKLHIRPFITAMQKSIKFDLNEVFLEEDLFSDFIASVDRYLAEKPEKNVALMSNLKRFLEALRMGVSPVLQNAYDQLMKDDPKGRMISIVKLRQEGRTLEEVGQVLWITRERVRQLESKAVRRFSKCLKNSKINVIAFLHALLDGDLMIHKEELASCVPDENHLELLWACIEDGALDSRGYYYQSKYKAIVFSDEKKDNDANTISELPSYIFADDLEKVVRHAVDEEGVLEEKLRADIARRYQIYGKLYSEHRPTVVFMCDWILKHRFISGFKVNDEMDYQRFIGYMKEVFGDKVGHMTRRALDAKVGEVGLLCDRGKYIHPSTFQIDTGLFQEIDQFIEDSPKNALSYIELFEIFKDRLAGTQISNHYFLQGAIKAYRKNIDKRSQYYLFRDYVTKDSEVSTTDELDAFVRDRGIVHQSEIFAEFPALNSYTITQVVARCSDIYRISNGNYVHSSHFNIAEDDYPQLRDYLCGATNDLPINIRKIYDDCSAQFPDFMDRNEIYDRDILFAVLRYMFNDEFRFDKPYIGKKNEAELTNRSVILSMIEAYDEIPIDELMEMLDEHVIHYVSIPNLLRLIAPDFIRVDENLLMRYAHTGLNEDVIEEALSILNEEVEAQGFLPSGKVQDFIWYPAIDVAWNPYLLESIVMISDIIDYIPYTIVRSQRLYFVYVSDRYKDCDFSSLLLQIVAEEYDKGSFSSKADMRDWLIEVGLIDVGLPNYLETAQYYYMQDGKLLKRESNDESL